MFRILPFTEARTRAVAGRPQISQAPFAICLLLDPYPVRVIRRSSAPVTVSRSDRFRSFHLGPDCHQIGLVQCLSLQEILRRSLKKIPIGFKKSEGALEHAIDDVAHL